MITNLQDLLDQFAASSVKMLSTAVSGAMESEAYLRLQTVDGVWHDANNFQEVTEISAFALGALSFDRSGTAKFREPEVFTLPVDPNEVRTLMDEIDEEVNQPPLVTTEWVVWNEGQSWAAVVVDGVDRVKVMCEVSTYAPTNIFKKARDKAMGLAEKIAAMMRKAA
jgi:hypothetical protein